MRGGAPCDSVRPAPLAQSVFKADTRAQTRAEWQAFKADLQQESYDVILDLQGLTKSALVAWLARKAKGGQRYALANRTDGSGYERPTRWVADVARANHATHPRGGAWSRAVRQSLGL